VGRNNVKGNFMGCKSERDMEGGSGELMEEVPVVGIGRAVGMRLTNRSRELMPETR